MAVKSLVLEVNASSPAEAQASINAVLTATPIAIVDYLESITIAYKEKNQTAMIVIWYNDGT